MQNQVKPRLKPRVRNMDPRRRALAAIHVIKGKCMTEDEYRRLLDQRYGVRSSKDLSDEQLSQFRGWLAGTYTFFSDLAIDSRRNALHALWLDMLTHGCVQSRNGLYAWIRKQCDGRGLWELPEWETLQLIGRLRAWHTRAFRQAGLSDEKLTSEEQNSLGEFNDVWVSARVAGVTGARASKLTRMGLLESSTTRPRKYRLTELGREYLGR